MGVFSSVATHWLPKIIKEFQKDYPNIEYEMLLGDYNEISQWIMEGRVDFGFTRKTSSSNFETIDLEKDELMAVIPKDHPLAKEKTFPVKAFEKEPFMLLERGGKTDIMDLFLKNGVKPKVKFTTWDDYAVMSMVEQGLGISILPNLILKRIPYDVVVKPLDKPAYREIVIAVKKGQASSAAMKKFFEYVKYRNN